MKRKKIIKIALIIKGESKIIMYFMSLTNMIITKLDSIIHKKKDSENPNFK